MKPSLLLLLWLTAVTPFAHATDWLNWQKVGDASLTWGPFIVYTSQLRTPNGLYDGPKQNQALIITYQRNISRDELIEATRDQWQAQGVFEREPQSNDWIRTLQSLWPNVSAGTQLAFVFNDKRGQFWYRESAKHKSFTPLGPHQSEAFSSRFLGIWLDPRTQYPTLRQQLIGGEE